MAAADSIVGCCRAGNGIQAPEMADELAKQGHYSPLPSHNMWAFGLLLLKLLGGHYSKACLGFHGRRLDATLAYAQSLCHLRPAAYLSQVC